MADLSVFGRLKSKQDYDREEQLFQLARQERMLARTGQTPAAVQLANEIQKARASGDTQRVKDLIGSAKIYDRGVTLDAGGNPIAMEGYGDAIGSIAGTKKAYETQAQKDIEAVMNPRIERATRDQTNASNIAAAAPLAESTDIGKISADRRQNYTKAQSAIVSFGQKQDIVLDNVNKAQELIKKSPNMSTGYGQVFSTLPNTSSRALNNYLNTIKANVGFDQLQTMRENSPTGGALGGVSENENKLLQAVSGALDPLQADTLNESLATIKDLYPKVMAEKKRAFDQDYGSFAPVGGGNAPQTFGSDNTVYPMDSLDIPVGQVNTPGPPAPGDMSPGPATKLNKIDVDVTLFNARKALKEGADLEDVRARLIENGIDPSKAGI